MTSSFVYPGRTPFSGDHMRTLTTPAVLLALALAACGTDATQHPVAPSAQAVARGSHADADARVKHIRGTMVATETGTPQPGNPSSSR